MKSILRPVLLALTALAITSPSQAALLAHYQFDGNASDAGTSGGTATLGSAAAITTGAMAWDGNDVNDIVSAVGSGALRLTTPTTDTTGSDGAVSANDFNWGASGLNSDIRSVAFWMRADGTQDTNATMLSLGSGNGAGNRFDVRLTGSALRLEIQSGGTTTTAVVGDGNWYHVTLSVSLAASTLADVQYFIHDTTATLITNGSGSMSGANAINTGTGPLRIGDSYQDFSRDFAGLLDDVRLYDTALTETDAANLAGMWAPTMIPEPSVAIVSGLGLFGLLLRRRRN